MKKPNNPKCVDCSEILNTRNRYVKRCWNCYLSWYKTSGRKPHNFKGFQMKNGYRKVYINRERPQVLEHRYIMEVHLNRPLKNGEIVHHINGIRDDNRIENLVLTNKHDHEHNTFIKRLQERIRDLETSITTAA